MVVMGIFCAVLLLVQGLIRMNLNDDAVYVNCLQNQTLFSFLQERYATWSSRVIIEAVMLPLVMANSWIWRILNILVVLLLVWNTADLFAVDKEKIKAQSLFFLMMWVIPLGSLYSAGWITTTTNYLWALAIGLMGLRPLKHFLTSEKCSWWEYIICPICVLYGANMEQMSAILLGAYLVVGIYMLIQKKKLSPFYWVLIVEIVCSLLFILVAPGNAERTLAETAHYFPEYENFGVAEKLVMGFVESAHYYIAGGQDRACYVFPLLVGVLLFLLIQKNRQGGIANRKSMILQLIVGLVPFVFHWGMTRLIGFLFEEGLLTRGLNLIGLLVYNRQTPSVGQYSWGQVWLQIAVYAVILGCVAATICLLHGKSKETLLELTILAAGFASRFMMGFSPTIYVSGDRTALFCSVAILIVALRNMQFFFKTESKWYWKLGAFLYVGICVAGNLL